MSGPRLLLGLVAIGLLIGGLYLMLRGGRPATVAPASEALLPIRDRPSANSQRPALTNPGRATPLFTEVDLAGAATIEAAVAQQQRHVDPRASGWDSETAADILGALLERIVAWVTAGDRGDEINELAGDEFQAALLAPTQLTTVIDDREFLVRRSGEPVAVEFRSRDLRSSLEAMFGLEPVQRLKFKNVGVTKTADGWSTDLLVESVHESGGQLSQRNATWICEWSREELRRLTETRLEVVQRPGDTALFADVTASAMRDVETYRAQVLHGIDHFTARQSKLDEMTLYGHHGLAIGDVNGDGLDDLYVCDAGGLPNRLYVQRADGSLEDRSAASQTDWLESSSSALLIDLDNDGDRDLVVATVPLILFAENDGTGRFTLKGGHAAVADPLSMTAADYDLDGDLDLYVCGYNDVGRASRFGIRGLESATPIPYHDANNGGRNALLENRGGFTFVDVTDSVGLDHNNTRFSFAAAWEDFDNDGDPDLYVANDFGRNNLYRNDGGRFRDIAAEAGVEDMAAGMSAAWGDANRDGLMDLYVGNMFSAAGNRVAYQRRFTAARDDETTRGLQRMARGNTLFHGRADHRFEDVSEAAGVTMGRWAWGSRFGDLNNDGWPDLVVANGFFTGRRPDDL